MFVNHVKSLTIFMSQMQFFQDVDYTYVNKWAMLYYVYHNYIHDSLNLND
jgi:hypothetical protein